MASPTANPEIPAAAASDEPVLEKVARAKSEAERAAIIAALTATNWNRRQAAVKLQIDYKALLYKMKKLSVRKEKSVLRMPAPSGQHDEAHSPLLTAVSSMSSR
jgi:DNA-binding NtrC family response regulator